MKRFSVVLLAVSCCVAGTPGFAQGQPSAKPAAGPTKAAPVGGEPGATTATYGDWTLRCQRIGEGDKTSKVCEVVQAVQAANQRGPIAQIAIGHLPGDATLRLTAALPVNLSFPNEIRLNLPGSKPIALTLELRRCLPSACFADMEFKGDQMKTLLAADASGTLGFRDAAGQVIAVPVSPRGLQQAVAALQKED